MAYISRKGEVEYFQNLLGNDKVVVSYQAGAYYLMYVRSDEEVNLKQIAELNLEIENKISQYNISLDPVEKTRILSEINEAQTGVYNRYDILSTSMRTKYTKPVRIFYSPKLMLTPGVY